MHWTHWLSNQSPLSAPLPVAPPAMEGKGGGDEEVVVVVAVVVVRRGGVMGTQSQAQFTPNAHIHAGRSTPVQWFPLHSVAPHILNVQEWNIERVRPLYFPPVNNKNVGWQDAGRRQVNREAPQYRRWIEKRNLPVLKVCLRLKWQARLKCKGTYITCYCTSKGTWGAHGVELVKRCDIPHCVPLASAAWSHLVLQQAVGDRLKWHPLRWEVQSLWPEALSMTYPT